jgi:hypothetical protein
VSADRPADLGDGCFEAGGQRISQPLSLRGSGQCATLFPVFGDVRLAAGQPLAEDVLKCQLRPVDLASYPVTFTADQVGRLRATFPGGVCDYGQPGAGQVGPRGTWISYG